MPAMKKVASKKTKPEDLGSIFTKLIDKIPPDTPPVEFDVPLEWLKMTKRSKPVDYQYIKRNIYPTKKKIKRRFEDDGIFCSCNTTMGSTVVCGRDCHCGMLRSTCSSGCRCGSSCLNKPFHQRPVKKMKVVKTEKCGSGVVAHEDIKQGEFVIEYVGEVIDDNTCEERLWEMKRSGETNFYLCEINRDMVIDATYKGNISRYINHSCSPNTEMQKWTIDGETRIGIFAIRGIKRGEQLTYDYQFVQFGADQECHCGAAGCRKKLGAKANKLKMSSSDAALQIVSCQVAAHTPVKVIRPWEDDNQSGVLRIGSSRNAANEGECTGYCIDKIVRIKGPGDTWKFGLVKRFHSHTGKHTIMFEDGQHEVLDMSKEDWKFFPE